MKRQGFASFHISSLHLQQGLCASLALLVTLIGGQQLVRWQQDTPSQAVSLPAVVYQQQHFSTIKTNALDSSVYAADRYELAAAEETQIANSQPAPERWVF
jgi:hypothetical protein